MRIALGLLTCFAVLVHCITGKPTLPSVPETPRRDAPFEHVRTRRDRVHRNKAEDERNKYFHESTFGEHYDGRFANKKLNYDNRRKHLTALIQTYLSSMNDIGAETWIMHGSLLGWWWNRKILPWDSDLDVMVSEKSIHHLAQYYNMTIHHYHLPGLDEGRDYMLEVNPHYNNDSIESANKIDARWIDTDTGLYIDITTLRRNKTAEALGIDGAMMVKDKHHYMFDDIFPLRQSTFEGFTVMVPFAYGALLVEEYTERALTQVSFEDHRFDAEKQEWVPLSCHDFGTCAYLRDAIEGVELPPDDGRQRPFYDPAKDGMMWAPARRPRNHEDRSLPPRLLSGRPWTYGRWYDQGADEIW